MASPSCGLFSRTAPIRTADRKHTPPSGPAARRTRGRPGYWDWAREPALWEETFPGLDFGICSVTYRTFTVSQRLQLKPPIVVGFEHYIGGADAFLVAEYPACRPVHGRDGPSSCCPRPLGQALRARRSGNRPIRVPVRRVRFPPDRAGSLGQLRSFVHPDRARLGPSCPGLDP